MHVYLKLLKREKMEENEPLIIKLKENEAVLKINTIFKEDNQIKINYDVLIKDGADILHEEAQNLANVFLQKFMVYYEQKQQKATL